MRTRLETPFGTMFQPWPIRHLPEVAFFQEGPGLRKWQWTEAGMKVINVTNILGDGSVDVNNTARFIASEEFERKYTHFAVEAGDIVVASSGNTYGKVGRITHAHLPLMMNTSVIRFHSSNPCTLDQGYLYAFLRSPLFRNQVESYVIGSAQPNFGPSHLKRMVIPCPEVTVQRKIASILSAYDDLIENNTRRIAILEEMAHSLYREWFVEFRFPGHEKARFIDSPLGRIPEGWKPFAFKDLLESMRGGDWGSETPNDDEDQGVVVVRGTDFEEVGYGGSLRVPLRYISSTSFESRQLRDGDVIVENSVNAKSRCVGTPLLVDAHTLSRLGDAAIAASFCKVFRLREPSLAPVAHSHLRYLRHTKRMEYFQNTAANGIGNFQAKKFSDEECLPLPEQPHVRGDLIAPLAGICDAVSVSASRCANLRTTRDLLLPKLMSGQVDVEDLDIDIGESLAEADA